jgi:hypothetical protein
MDEACKHFDYAVMGCTVIDHENIQNCKVFNLRACPNGVKRSIWSMTNEFKASNNFHDAREKSRMVIAQLNGDSHKFTGVFNEYGLNPFEKSRTVLLTNIRLMDKGFENTPITDHLWFTDRAITDLELNYGDVIEFIARKKMYNLHKYNGEKAKDWRLKVVRIIN